MASTCDSDNTRGSAPFFAFDEKGKNNKARCSGARENDAGRETEREAETKTETEAENIGKFANLV